MALISFTDRGLYCEQGDFYIDPWKPVRRAVITHGHADHSRTGNQFYFAHTDSYRIMKWRLGQDISLQTAGYNQSLNINGVSVTLYPAGHIIGSAQVRVEYKGEVWVVSGDYKIEDDGVTVPFEPVKCHTFITESTFGLPIYQWKPQAEIISNIHDWVLKNRAQGRYSVLSAYSLGKSQRLVHALAQLGHKFYAHGSVYYMNEVIKEIMPFPHVHYLRPETPKDEVKDGIIMIPPSAINTPWIRKWAPHSLGMCSGWMQVRGAQRRRNADAGFPFSDHADWPGLLEAIKATGASQVYATHGFTAALSRFLREEYHLDAGIVKTAFGEDEE
ncbi:MAG: ligase-associated DNA damage response exonuclease [Sphingobacteriales bacterium]|nr:MAG: ligase-associated DNA damage response exonuclease [Sphingobacteriales bacterium]